LDQLDPDGNEVRGAFLINIVLIIRVNFVCLIYFQNKIDTLVKKRFNQKMFLPLDFAISAYLGFDLFNSFGHLSENEIAQLSQSLGLGQHDDISSLIQHFGSKYSSLDNYLELFARLGSVEWIEEVVSQGATKLNNALCRAANHGKVHCVRRLVDLGANNVNRALIGALSYGHFDVIYLLVEKGANNFDRFIDSATAKGRLDIVELAMDKGYDVNKAMAWAANYGRMDLIDLCLGRGANDFNETLKWAAVSGHVNIANLMFNCGANNLEEALDIAEAWENQEFIDAMS
jgi:hypothetical protein